MSENGKPRSDIYLIAPLIGVVMQAGALIWYLGKMDARMEAQEKTVVELKNRVEPLAENVSMLRASVTADPNCRLRYEPRDVK